MRALGLLRGGFRPRSHRRDQCLLVRVLGQPLLSRIAASQACARPRPCISPGPPLPAGRRRSRAGDCQRRRVTLLPSGADRRTRAFDHDLQAPHHEVGWRLGRAVELLRRPARHADWAVLAPHAPRRAASTPQRATGRDEHRRAAARAARVRRPARAHTPLLRAPPSDQARDHRVGPDPVRLCRVRSRVGLETLP
jgi:hypothetical protein